MGTALFPLGQTVVTRNAHDTLDPRDVAAALARHAAGDWGELCDQDRKENALSLQHGWRLFSVYRDRSGAKFYVITEGDRSVTTILLPEDY
jgi:hypothetical protein